MEVRISLGVLSGFWSNYDNLAGGLLGYFSVLSTKKPQHRVTEPPDENITFRLSPYLRTFQYY